MSDLAPFLGSRAQKGFLGTILVQGLIVLCMLAISLGLVEGNTTGDRSSSKAKSLPCYFAVFALAQMFHITLSIDALRLRNIIQIIGLLIFQGMMIIYGAIQLEETKSSLVGVRWGLIEPFLIVIPVVLGVTWGLLIWLAWILYGEFGWFVFRVVGADPKLKRMFEYYQIMIVLLKFDYFAFLGLSMQLLILVLNNDTAQYAITIAAIPIVLVLLTMAGIAVAREIKLLMILALVLLLASQAYFIFKFTRLFVPATRHQYDSTRKTVGVFIVGAFLLDFTTFWVGLKCYLDFDQGLRSSKMNEPTLFTRAHFHSSHDEKSARHSVGGRGNGHGGTPLSPLSNNGGERASYFAGGEPLQQRMSIE